MHTRYLQRTILAALCLLFTILSPLGNANTLYAVSLDTSGLVGNAAGPFTLDFILRGGSVTGNANNTVSLIDFNFGEGSFTLPDPHSHSNTQEVQFPSLNKLSFRVDTTNNPQSPEPDSFIFKILDNNGNPIPTTDTMNNSFLTIVLNPAPGKVSTYGTPDGTIGAPTVQLLSSTNVPEPPTSLLVAIGLGGLLATRRSLGVG